jgi:stage II sporulation protein E
MEWKSQIYGRQSQFILFIVALLLARAMLFEELTPFAIAFFGVMVDLRKSSRVGMFIAILLGGLLAEHHHLISMMVSCGLFAWLHAMLNRRAQLDFQYVPLLVFISSFFSLVGQLVVTVKMDWYPLLLAVAESSLAFVLALIFMQAVPLLLDGRKPTKLRNEEIICLLILLGAIMVGTVGWSIEGIAFEHVFSRYTLLLMAMIGGVPLGATVGVVTGLIISFVHPGSISQVGVLAFAGMLAGLLREGKRLAVGFGMLIGTAVLSLYVGQTSDFITSLVESAIAILLFVATPQSLLVTISKWIPGTNEYAKSQIDYARRVRGMTADRVKQFSEVFQQLAKSFAPLSPQPANTPVFGSRIIKVSEHVWRKQMHESRKLVADQLYGVSLVMEDLASEIQREGQQMYQQEEQIRKALENLGLSISEVTIICLDEGKIEIEMLHQFVKGFDECRKLIAPLLSDITGETIVVKRERFGADVDGYYTVTFGSARGFEIETGVAGAAKGGELLSGDSYSTVELSNGKFALALSDGMGNGWRANGESQAALSILQQLLESGMDEKLAIKSVNSVLLLRSQEEMFATIDLALVDLNNARTTFMKIGSTPSFIKRGNEVISISAHNLPAGILQEIDVDLITFELLPGDTVVMMTDGIYDAPGHHINKERWMQKLLREIESDNPQHFADLVLERVVRHHNGAIQDDMTVVVARIEKYVPEWRAFPWHGVAKLDRPKTVS